MNEGVVLKDYQLNILLGVFASWLKGKTEEDETSVDRKRFSQTLTDYLWNDEHVPGEEFILVRKVKVQEGQ